MEMMTSRRSLSCVFVFFAMVILVSLVSCHGEELAGKSAVLPPQVSATSTEVMKDEQRNKDYYNVQVRKGNRKNGGGGGGGGWGWGNGGGGGGGGGGGRGGGGGGGGGGGSSGSIGGGGGWGWGGGGGGWWGWGCMSPKRNKHNGGGQKKKRRFSNEDYIIGEYAECMGGGRCQGMRLDCPLHCGGPCFYDCKNMCKAHCRRPQH